MQINDFYQNKYLKAEDLDGKDLVLTIRSRYNRLSD